MKHWLEDLYRQHRSGLLSLAVSVVRETAAAEDAVHEAFARLVKLAEPPTGEPVPYVFRAVRNAAIDQVRRRGRQPATSQQSASLFAAPLHDGPGDLAEAKETQAMLKRAVDNLPAPEREAIALRCFAGLTFREMSQALDEPISTVSSRYQRGLTLLRETMEARHANA